MLPSKEKLHYIQTVLVINESVNAHSQGIILEFMILFILFYLKFRKLNRILLQIEWRTAKLCPIEQNSFCIKK